MVFFMKNIYPLHLMSTHFHQCFFISIRYIVMRETLSSLLMGMNLKQTIHQAVLHTTDPHQTAVLSKKAYLEREMLCRSCIPLHNIGSVRTVRIVLHLHTHHTASHQILGGIACPTYQPTSKHIVISEKKPIC